MKRYNNYHKHDHVSSILTPDSCVMAEDYIKRAVELGHDTYFTTNHGTGGDIFEARTLCDKYGLRCLFGLEGYIVPNPLEKDKRNYHIIIIPRTDEARKKVNYVNSMAHVKGYYYRPRIFLDDLLALDKDDVYITTACVAGIVHDKDAIEQIFLPLVKHFGKNVYLEVQPHNCDVQKSYNQLCIDLAKKHNLELIAANDSHYVYPEQAEERKKFLEGKGISYKDEGEDNAFILDYPDRDTMVERFIEQGVLTSEQIERAIDNTLIFDSCEEIKLDKEIKMPSIYPNLTPQERVDELKKHVNKRFKQIAKEENLSSADIKRYTQGIRDEMQVIQDTMEINTADYFLFNEKNVDLAVNKYGGILTRTGRGSCGAYYINRILGITQIDRFASPIPLYPERFISSARLLENRAIPDIDYNVVAQEPFQKASKELLGENGCYPMIAYGTMQEGEAFRNVCRSHGLEFTEYNDVAKDIDAYRDDDKWKPLIEEAQKYVGVIVSGSVHPCAFLLLDKDIVYEYGVVRQGDAICVMMTSLEADDYKFLKND